MSSYFTVVIRAPDDPSAKARMKEGLRLLEPYQVAMSIEDEMTVLDLIEQHEDFEDYIADEARAKAKELHAIAESHSTPHDDADNRLPPPAPVTKEKG